LVGWVQAAVLIGRRFFLGRSLIARLVMESFMQYLPLSVPVAEGLQAASLGNYK